jgi:myo-inositol-1(or 4)-monophosphatase
MTDNNALVGRALAFASQAHAGQLRKGSHIPYIVHPAEAVAICARLTDDPCVIAAAALHDVVEDTGATIEEIRTLFGDRVTQIVASESEDKRHGLPPSATWRQRKQEAIDHISQTDDPGVLAVCLADKLSNLRSTYHDFCKNGDAVWSRFNVTDPAQHAWYYSSLLAALRPRFGNTLEWQEMGRIVDELFGAYL